MKVKIYEEVHSGKLRFYNTPQPENVRNWHCLGEMEIEPKLPKKVVTKEIKIANGQNVEIYTSSPLNGGAVALPNNSKNIRIVYEVEE